jgi:hypothetical protein
MTRRNVVFLIVLSLPAAAQITCGIRTAHANARKSASSSSTVLAVLNRGDLLQVAADVPYWFQVVLKDGTQAYVAKSTCSVVPASDPGEEDTSSAQDFYNPPTPSPTTTSPSCTPKTIPADWTVCPAAGSGGIHAMAYTEKNRVTVACSYEPTTVDQILELDHLPANVRALPTSDKRVTYLNTVEGKSVVVDGYLAMVKDGGKEGVNCGSTTRVDIHMELVDTDSADPKTNRKSHVVTEITPWFEESISAWTEATMAQYSSYSNGYSGSMHRPPTHVRVYGHMFFDDAHAKDGSVGTWRGTEWEVHPITKIEVWDNGAWKSIE